MNKPSYGPFSELASEDDVRRLLAGANQFFYACRYTRSWADLFVSEGVETVTQYSRSAFESGAVSFDALFDPCHVDEVRAAYSQQLLDNGRYTIETAINRKDGTVGWIRDTGFLVRRPGAAPYIVGVCVDETQALSEAFRRRLAESRAQAVKTLNARTASVIAHEIRTPLNILTGFLDLMELEWDRLSKEKIGDYRRYVADAAAQMTAVIETMASGDDYRAGEGSIVQTTLLSVVREAVSAVAASSGREVATIIDAKALNETIVFVDREALKAAIVELVDNARRHAGDGATVFASVRLENGSPALFIEDDGPGLLESEREDAMMPFVKPRGRENVGSAGIGLGLPRVVRIMRELSGAFRLGDRAGGGLSCVCVLNADDLIAAPGAASGDDDPAIHHAWVAEP